MRRLDPLTLAWIAVLTMIALGLATFGALESMK